MRDLDETGRTPPVRHPTVRLCSVSAREAARRRAFAITVPPRLILPGIRPMIPCAQPASPAPPRPSRPPERFFQ